VYRHELFAQGVRSALERESGVQIVGMENDVARAARAVRALRPEVILVEEPTESGVAWPILEWAAASRIVTFSMQHAYATVYHPHRTAAGDPVDLIRAIQEARAGEMPRGPHLDVQG
jgi:DNA-binding NarL/FixJ family response regulator